MLTQVNYFKTSFLILSICLVFQSCETQDSEVNPQENEQLSVKENNQILIKEFQSSFKNKSENSDLTAKEFSMQFYSYQLLDENNNVIVLGEEMKANNISSEDLFQMFQEKKVALENISIKISDAEIRSAMMDECGEYYLLEYPCKAAVEIAYVLR